jgi:hypothetical protein
MPNLIESSDDSSSNDEYDVDDDDDEDEIIIDIYDSDETSKTRFNLVLCEIYNDKRHGQEENNMSNYLTLMRVKYNNNYNFDNLYTCADAYNKMYKLNSNNLTPHSYIKNYKNIINGINYIKPEIAECIVLPSGCSISIIKTIWLRLIQRKWKRMYRLRREFIEKISCYSALKEWQCTGKWPTGCYERF